MKKILIISAFLFSGAISSRLMAQRGPENIPYYDISFAGRFAMAMEEDNSARYYALNAGSITDELERKVFTNELFGRPGLVRLDSGNPVVYWVKTDKQVSDFAAGEAYFTALLAQVKERCAAMSAAERNQWTTSNPK